MEAKEYQNLAMRTNDGKGTERLEKWIREETGAEYKGDVMIENEIDAGGLLNGCLGLSGEAVRFLFRITEHKHQLVCSILVPVLIPRRDISIATGIN